MAVRPFTIARVLRWGRASTPSPCGKCWIRAEQGSRGQQRHAPPTSKATINIKMTRWVMYRILKYVML